MASLPFLEQRWGIYCGEHHPLFGRDYLTIAELKAEDFVSFTSKQMGDALSPLSMFRDERGFGGKIVATSPCLDEIERLIYTEFWIRCSPQHIGADLAESSRLWPLPPAEGVVDVPISLAWHSERKMNMAFSACFKRYMSSISLPERLGRAWERRLKSIEELSAPKSCCPSAATSGRNQVFY